MKVAIFGGTGFVGSYLVNGLLDQGHLPVVMVRPRSEEGVLRGLGCKTVSGSISDQEAVQRTISGVDAVIYNIGILREQRDKGVTFEALQFDGAKLAIDTAVDAGVRRFLLMSANGVRVDGTAYQKTKYNAEQYLQSSPLEWTIFRPSVIFGDPRGRTEFATLLHRDIVTSPLPAPLFYDGIIPLRPGSMKFSPVHVGDVADFVVKSLRAEQSIGQIYPLGGPNVVTWKRILQIIGEATGRRVFGVPTPACAVMTAARLLENSAVLPVTRDQIRMLMEGNTCDSSQCFREFGIEPTTFDAEHLRYLGTDRNAAPQRELTPSREPGASGDA